MKILRISSAALLAMFAIVFVACQKDVKAPSVTSDASKKTALDAPTVSCVGVATQHSLFIQVTAGATGAPAGFTVQWQKASNYDGKNFVAECQASFSGVPGCSQYNLVGAGAKSQIIEIGNLSDVECGVSGGCGDLECGTAYVFRVFAHNDPATGLGKSAFSTTTTCSTAACGTGECTTETAFGGSTNGNLATNGAWFYYYDATTSGVQPLWAGQYQNAGTVEYVEGKIKITLADGWSLQDVDEPVKIQGYTTVPTTRPAAGQFTTYKGKELIVDVESFPYYIVHVDVKHCN